MTTLYTIGHSSHPAEHFLALLRQHGIQVVVDTRSAPYSRFAPHFDRESLRASLAAAGLRYMYLGDVIGGRPRESHCYDDAGRVLYARVAELDSFRAAIDRLQRGASEYRVALLCAEEDPAHCHRRLLVTRVLLTRGYEVLHLRGDGSLETDADVARRSGKALIEPQASLFDDADKDSWRSKHAIAKPAARSPLE